MLTINDIGKISDHEYEAFCDIWGNKTNIYIDVSVPDADIEKCLPAINAKLRRLDTGKAELFRAPGLQTGTHKNKSANNKNIRNGTHTQP